MAILDRIFSSNREKEYKKLLSKIYNPIRDKIYNIEEREIKDFFETILDAAERSLRGILFLAPEEFNFEKKITIEEIDFWLRKVSLALISYSYYGYSNIFVVEKNKKLSKLISESYDAY